MGDIALPAFHVTTVKKVVVEAPYEMGLELHRYRAFYKSVYGAEVSEADLIREMARRFMEADREFAAFKSGLKTKTRSAPKPTANSASEGSSS